MRSRHTRQRCRSVLHVDRMGPDSQSPRGALTALCLSDFAQSLTRISMQKGMSDKMVFQSYRVSMLVSQRLSIFIDRAMLFSPSKVVLNHDLPSAPQSLSSTLHDRFIRSVVCFEPSCNRVSHRSQQIIGPNRPNSSLLQRVRGSILRHNR